MNPDTTPDSPIGLLLRRAACVDDDEAAREAIRQACRNLATESNWDRAIDQAEQHGLAPYLHRQITRCGADIPTDPRRKLQSLALRHRDSNRIRDQALTAMLKALDAHGIDVLVLKGAALAHLIYDPPGLRPMSDVDLLVAPDRLQDAAGVLLELGYSETGRPPPAADHHHLPPLSKTAGGLSICVEIHHDALAPDNIGSIRLDRLTEPARGFRIDGTAGWALGHIDMLRHLWRHALQPRQTTKLGSALDIMLYASRFTDDIDWRRVERDFPEIPTGLSLLAFLVPLPRSLSGRIPEPVLPAPRGVGVGMPPLSRIRHQRNRLSKILNPSDWWLRAFYNVPPGRPLAATRLVRHPARVLYWLWRRIGK